MPRSRRALAVAVEHAEVRGTVAPGEGWPHPAAAIAAATATTETLHRYTCGELKSDLATTATTKRHSQAHADGVSHEDA